MNSQIKLVCFDLNKTLIKENSWYDLNLALGITPEQDQYYLDQYNEGKLSYRRWIKLLSEHYLRNPQATYTNIKEVLRRYTHREGARSVVRYLQTRGYRIALVSGAMDILVNEIADDLGIELRGANNRFIFAQNGNLIGIRVLGDDPKVKLRILQKFCQSLGIKITECACVGDGDNDHLLFEASKHGVTFKGSVLEPTAWKVVTRLSDLKKVFK